MPLFTKESLENLRQKIDLIEVLSAHLDLKRAGSAYKALCPFHEEKTPSLLIQRGDAHYHCFGCGAHGDAIQFLTSYLKMSFTEAVESLAERFHVILEKKYDNQEKGVNKLLLKEALAKASEFYQFCLLYTPEGHQAYQYLKSRAIDLDFIRRFQLGWAPSEPGILRKILQAQGVTDEVMVSAGLLTAKGYRDFFQSRITFPIQNSTGSVIGFSARKFQEEVFGGKYINTPETPLFKKSKILFGLNYSRRRIAKELQVLLVEGQIDALRLIHSGFDFAVAVQGTAFGEEHAKELQNLGIQKVVIAFDGDGAGREASCKAGNFFQKIGLEVKIIELPSGIDPDSFIKNHGPEKFSALISTARDYLDFLIDEKSRSKDLKSPAVKNGIVEEISKQIKDWDHSVMVYESLKKLANAMEIPESSLEIGKNISVNPYFKRSGTLEKMEGIDADLILESDLLRWLLLFGHEYPHLVEMAKLNLKEEDLKNIRCRKIFKAVLNLSEPISFMSLAMEIEDEVLCEFASNLTQKKLNKERIDIQYPDAIQKILDRNWMEKSEKINIQIQSGHLNDIELLKLVKEFNDIKFAKPKVKQCQM